MCSRNNRTTKKKTSYTYITRENFEKKKKKAHEKLFLYVWLKNTMKKSAKRSSLPLILFENIAYLEA